MAKNHNRFVIDTSRRGKFSENDIVIHALPPRFIAEAMLLRDEAYKELESKMSAAPIKEIAYTAKQLRSGNWIVLVVLDWWDFVETGSPAELKEATESVKLALKSYNTYMAELVKEASIDELEMRDCLEFMEISIKGSEAKYIDERFSKSDEEQEAYRQNIVIAKWIRKYLKQLRDLSRRVNTKL